MLKTELIREIIRLSPDYPFDSLKKLKKKDLENMLTTINSKDAEVKKEVKKMKEKKVKKSIIEFSESDTESEKEDVSINIVKVEEKEVSKPEPEPQPQPQPEPQPEPEQERSEASSCKTSEPQSEPKPEPEPKKQKFTTFKIKSLLRMSMKTFTDDVKKALHEYKETNDKDFLMDTYQLILQDTEEHMVAILDKVEASDQLYEYANNLLQPYTNKINRILR